jgi:hypothetical protein
VKELSGWSLRRVIVACVLWLLGAPVLGAIGLMLGGLVLATFSGRQAISFSVGLSNWSLAWLFLPPILLVAAWLRSRKGAD